MAPKRLTSKFAGHCRGCGKGISKGSPIVWQGRRKGTYHEECWPGEQNPNPKAEEDTDMRQVLVESSSGWSAVCGHNHKSPGEALACSRRCKARLEGKFPGETFTISQTTDQITIEGLRPIERVCGVNVDMEDKPAKPADDGPECGRYRDPAKPAPATPAADVGARIAAAVMGELGGLLDESKVAQIATAAAEATLDARLSELQIGAPKLVKFEFPDGSKIEPREGEIQHPEFERLARYIGGGVNRIWITGEAGTGKTHAVEQIAESLGRKLYVVTPVADKYELFGYCDANGNYVATQVYEWATSDDPNAILLLDEIDAFMPSALVAANAALANGAAVFPKHGIVSIATTKTVIATANTTGEGASLRYSARFAQDGALLDRFQAYLHWGLHEPTERVIALALHPVNTTPKAVDASVQIRRNLEDAGIDLPWGPRRTYAIAACVKCGDSIRDAAITAGLGKLDENQQSRAMRGVR